MGLAQAPMAVCRRNLRRTAWLYSVQSNYRVVVKNLCAKVATNGWDREMQASTNTYTHPHTQTNTLTHPHNHTFTHPHNHTFTHPHNHTFIHPQTHTNTHTHKRIYTLMHYTHQQTHIYYLHAVYCSSLYLNVPWRKVWQCKAMLD